MKLHQNDPVFLRSPLPRFDTSYLRDIPSINYKVLQNTSWKYKLEYKNTCISNLGYPILTDTLREHPSQWLAPVPATLDSKTHWFSISVYRGVKSRLRSFWSFAFPDSTCVPFSCCFSIWKCYLCSPNLSPLCSFYPLELLHLVPLAYHRSLTLLALAPILLKTFIIFSILALYFTRCRFNVSDAYSSIGQTNVV